MRGRDIGEGAAGGRQSVRSLRAEHHAAEDLRSLRTGQRVVGLEVAFGEAGDDLEVGHDINGFGVDNSDVRRVLEGRSADHGDGRQKHNCGQEKCDKLFHGVVPPV